jgi:hypothetical protein
MTRRFTGVVGDCPPWGKRGSEPPLGEVLADPLVHAVMRCDGVSCAALDSLIARAQRRLRTRGHT